MDVPVLNGALAAGRQNSGASIFPYESDDRLHLATNTGPKTLVKLTDGRIWEPFSTGHDNPYKIRRNLYKRVTGDAVLFEELNECLQIIFSYRWETSGKYGIVRTTEIKNIGPKTVTLEILDGVENIIPHGIPPAIASNLTCLSDAYKACERPDGGKLAVYSLTSSIGDTVKPVEILRANTAWYIGDATTFLLSSKQVSAFVAGQVQDEVDSVGRKGAFIAYQPLNLSSGEEKGWMFILDAGLNQQKVMELLGEVNGTCAKVLRKLVEDDIAKGTDELVYIVAAADGLQHTNGGINDIRHYMNVLYNNMRGGVFLDGYDFDVNLFAGFLEMRNEGLADRRADFVNKLRSNSVCRITDLHNLALADGDADLIRLSLEFLPLTFSRRHGDPSRPWNYFDIRVKDEHGKRVYHYEGNWRDIFQNWEALGLSFPGYIAPMIAKFLNASTIDGFNPYRINTEGIDWETPAPHDPWSGIGYWGDHQIVYLNKLLEWLNAYMPEALSQLAESEIFTYADVPYEILPYESILQDSKHTIHFNQDKHNRLVERVKSYGSDGRLLLEGDNVYHVSLVEKLLVPILAKLSNLVIGGGIWMNTQRPEWNDANNAIVGNGLSMVTVYQLYRHLGLCAKLIKGKEVAISTEVKTWLVEIAEVINKRSQLTPKEFLDIAGEAFSRYRKTVYASGFSGKESLPTHDILSLLGFAREALEETIVVNKREDGMYHSYNIMTLEENRLAVSPLFLMLEGQTAVLGSGFLSLAEALELVAKMEASDLMNPLLGQFFLYPMKKLKTFVERNIIPSELAEKSQLIKHLLEANNDGLVLCDNVGNVRFHHNIRQLSDVDIQLDKLSIDPAFKRYAITDAKLIREIFEVIFAHNQFTGRSGVMYKYEGIGSIYWHQNSKFMLSLQETFTQGIKDGANSSKKLKDAYYRLQSGFGFRKTPVQWGAFPLEPYSHTPYNMPAQQPGMTGQVKEDIITRFAELGISVEDGLLGFEPSLLNQSEFLTKPSVFSYIDVAGNPQKLDLPVGTLAFTICQIPVVYHLAEHNAIIVTTKDDAKQQDSLVLSRADSEAVFGRVGAISRIDVCFKICVVNLTGLRDYKSFGETPANLCDA